MMTNEQNTDAGDPLAKGKETDELDAKLDAALASVAGMECDEDAASADAAWSAFQTKLAARSTAQVGEQHDSRSQDLDNTRLRPTGTAGPRTSVWRRIKTPSTGLGWFATAQTAALAAMAFVLIPQDLTSEGASDRPDEYRVLSSDNPAVADPIGGPVRGDAVLVFDQGMTLGAINATLGKADARIVDGPMANGGYVVQIDEERLDNAIEELREEEGVLLVEILNAQGE